MAFYLDTPNSKASRKITRTQINSLTCIVFISTSRHEEMGPFPFLRK